MGVTLVPVDDRGRALGEFSVNAKLTNREAELIRKMHEQDGYSYRLLANFFEISKSTVRDICTYRRRATTPAGYRKMVA